MYNAITNAVSKKSNPSDNTDTPPITNKNRTDWNNYIDWLDKKGLKGNAILDKGDTGMKMIDLYRKENPNTSITRDMVIPIQQEFSNYRNYALKQVAEGKAVMAPGVTKDNFLKSLSVVDNIPGQRTTSFKFPEGYMKDMSTGETKNVGYLTTDKSPIDQLTSTK